MVNYLQSARMRKAATMQVPITYRTFSMGSFFSLLTILAMTYNAMSSTAPLSISMVSIF